MKSGKSIIVIVVLALFAALAWYFLGNGRHDAVISDKARPSTVALESRQHFVTNFEVGEATLSGWQEVEVARAVSGLSADAEITVIGGSRGGEGLEGERVRNVIDFIKRLSPAANVRLEPSLAHFRGVSIITEQAAGDSRRFYVVDFSPGSSDLDQYLVSDINDILSKIPFMSEVVIVGSKMAQETDEIADARAKNVMDYIHSLRPQSKVSVALYKKSDTDFRGVVLSVADHGAAKQVMPVAGEKAEGPVREVPVTAKQPAKAKMAVAENPINNFQMNLPEIGRYGWLIAAICLLGGVSWLLRHSIAGLYREYQKRREDGNNLAQNKIRKQEDEVKRQMELDAYRLYDKPIFFETDQGVMAVKVKKNPSAALFLPPFPFKDDGKILACTENVLAEQLTLFVNGYFGMSSEDRSLSPVTLAMDEGTIYLPEGEEAEKAAEWLKAHQAAKEEQLAQPSASAKPKEAEAPIEIANAPVTDLAALVGGLVQIGGEGPVGAPENQGALKH